MNYDEMYFHGLAGFLDNNDIKRIVEVSLAQLDMILSSKGLYSKNKLDSMERKYYDGKPVLNGDDYISLCIKNPAKEEFVGLNEGIESSFNKYVKNRIAIVIDKDIVTSHEFRNTFDKLPGERQVKDYISQDYFKAIIVDLENPFLKNTVTDLTRDILNKYDINIPIIDSNYNILDENVEKNK